MESLHEALGLGSPTFDSLDIAGTLAHVDAQANKTCAQSGADAALKYVKGRTSALANNAWKNYLLKMENKALQATTADELRNVKRMAASYYEDLVSAMNVLSKLAQNFSATYTSHGKAANMLETHYHNIVQAVARGKARLEESANERKRSRSGTPPVHPLSLMPPSQLLLPGELVDMLKQIVEKDAKRPRPEAEEADARVRDLEKQLEMERATHALESKHGAKMAARESSFQAESNTLKEQLHSVQLENARFSAAMAAKAEVQVELTRANQAHFESSNTASCLKGALMMHSCTSFGAGGMSSRQVMGADQGFAALLGCSQSAPGGYGSLLPTAPPKVMARCCRRPLRTAPCHNSRGQLMRRHPCLLTSPMMCRSS